MRRAIDIVLLLSAAVGFAADLTVQVSSNATVTTVPLSTGSLVITQHFVIQETNATEFTPRDLPGLVLWWVDSDAEITNSPVTNERVIRWKDRVAGATWRATNALAAPYFTQAGLNFTGNQFLESTNANVGGHGGRADGAYWVLVKPAPISGFEPRPILWGENGYGLGWDPYLGGRFYHGAWVLCHTRLAPANAWLDLCVSSLVSDSWSYTNGVLLAYNQVSCGEIPNDAKWRLLGKNAFGFFKGYIKEIAVWTNHLGSNDVIRLHQYGQRRIKAVP